MICELWDVIVVPFPFTDRAGEKRRPVLVLSKQDFNRNGYTVMAMITSSAHPRWPGDAALTDFRAAGLRAPCIVRLKLFTLDNRLILRKIGRLPASDSGAVEAQLRAYLW